jgi:glycogen(starch) synthase
VRVGIFTPYYPGITGDSGIGTYTRQLATSLSKIGHQVHVVTPGDEAQISDNGVMVHVINTRHIPGLEILVPGAGASHRVAKAMSRLVRDASLDVLEFPNWEGLGAWFALWRRLPVVVRLHTSSLETIKIDGLPVTYPRRVDVWRERASAGLADALVTHSRAHQLTMASELRINPKRIKIVPHGIASNGRSSAEREPNTIVYVGRLERRKGAIDLLHAAPLVLRENPNVRFVMIGTDRAHCPGGKTHAEYLLEFPLEVRSRISLLGRLPEEEVEGWLRRATIFVAPSLYESFGLVFLEAMRHGTPVIGTFAGGIPEIVEHERSGLLVPPGDAQALAAAILNLMNDLRKRDRLGSAGKVRCEQEFSADMMARRMADLYASAIERWRR